MKKNYSISTIFSVILLLVFLLLVLPISFFSFNSFEKTLNENIANYMSQIKNNTETLMERESFVLDNLALELSSLLGNLQIENFNDLSMDNDNFYNEIDIFFIQKGSELINNSTSLFDTDAIIEKILEKESEKSCIYTVLVDKEHYAVLLSSNQIINAKTGRVEGRVFIGKILNDNFSLLKHFKEKVQLEGLSFYVNNEIIASSFKKDTQNYQLSSSIDNHINNDGIFGNNHILYSKIELSCNSSHTGVYIIPALDGTEFENLRNNFDKQVILLVFFFVIIGLLTYIVVKRFVISPMGELLDFAKDIKEKKSQNYDETIIAEYNTLGHGLQDIISELRDVKEQYTLAVEGTQDALWDWNITEDTIYFSERCKELIGYKKDEITLTIDSWHERINDEDKERVDKTLISHLKQEIPYFEGEFRILCKSGTYKWLKVRARALFNENRAYRMVGFYSDIDPLKKLEEENRQKEAFILEQSKMTAMGDMLSNIAHQWRQPLSAITTLVSGIKVTLELDLFDKDDIIRDLDIVTNTSQKLSKTIDTFKDSHTFGTQKKDFNLKVMLEKDMEVLKPALNYEHIEVVLNLEDIEYYGYKEELLMVINKLIQNSKDAIKNNNVKQGLIFISLEKINESLVISVKDNGLGIDSSIQKKIFEPYFTTKHKAQGVGLSLYMAKNVLIKYFNGDLTFENKEYTYHDKKQIGSEFKITFPLK